MERGVRWLYSEVADASRPGAASPSDGEFYVLHCAHYARQQCSRHLVKLNLSGVPKQAESRTTFSLKCCFFPQDHGCGEANTSQCSYSDKSNKLVEIGPI